jgi:hypothetical protein
MQKWWVAFATVATFSWCGCQERNSEPDAEVAADTLRTEDATAEAPDADPDAADPDGDGTVPDADGFEGGADVPDGDDVADAEGGDDADPAVPPPCCGVGDACPAGLVCEHSFSDGSGACVSPPVAGRCWSPTDCAADEFCAGPSGCPCDAASCVLPLEPGICAPVTTLACCIADAYCGAGQVCAGATGSSLGFCMPPPPAGRCYSLDDCPWGSSLSCDGATSCPCDLEEITCLPTPGVCTEAPGNPCCETDEDCTTGRCHHGACKEDPATGCWSDRGCAAGSFCRGETICPCGTICEVPDAPGSCVALPDGCCNSVHDCGSGEVCLGADDVVPGRCLAAPGERECWSGDDCPPSTPGPDAGSDWCYYCVGASFCPCVEACPGCPIECPANSVGLCEIDGCI